MLSKKIYLTILFITLLSGCASSKLGSYANYVDAEGRFYDGPLNVSARFETQACSSAFGYISLSLENKESDWKDIKDLRLHLPYQSNEFNVVQGNQLLAWFDAEGGRQARNQHNANLGHLAVRAVGEGLMASESSLAKSTGAGLQLASAVGVISSNKRQAERGGSNHLMAGDIKLPPKMDRQFWLLLGAKADAPLMNWIGLSYFDEHNMEHMLRIELDNWFRCSWQESRKKAVWSWAKKNRQVDKRIRNIVSVENKQPESLLFMESVVQKSIHESKLTSSK